MGELGVRRVEKGQTRLRPRREPIHRSLPSIPGSRETKRKGYDFQNLIEILQLITNYFRQGNNIILISPPAKKSSFMKMSNLSSSCFRQIWVILHKSSNSHMVLDHILNASSNV